MAVPSKEASLNFLHKFWNGRVVGDAGSEGS